MEKISVLMSLYHKEKKEYFEDAVRSILNQTYPFDEFVLVIDGSIPSSLEESVSKLEAELGDRLKVVRNPANLGLAKALNRGLEVCRNEWVARMDTDDVAVENRFEEQVRYIERLKNSGVALIGSWYDIYDEELKTYLSTRKVPEKHEEIVRFARRRTPINHPTVIFNKKAVMDVGGYPENIGRFEDWGLSLRLIKGGYRLYNIPKSLLKFRTSLEQMERRGGIRYLVEEFRALKNLYGEGLLTGKDFLINTVLRTPVRLVPNRLRKFVYTKFIWKDRKG